MPIRPELRWFYPIDWPELSRRIRFGRAGGRCEHCGRPHGTIIRQLEDGRWYDEKTGCWRDDSGDEAAWPDVVEYAGVRTKSIRLGTAHLDHDPANSKPANLRALCQRCHLRHDRKEHMRRRRITFNLRKALGDLFDGQYRPW
ncbi:MAG: hypothetical protein R3C97_04330 [Geminicoccaceae bacterium]